MGSYKIVAEVSSAIVQLLRNQLVPEVLTDSESIGLCYPNERENVKVCVCLYDVNESKEVTNHQMLDYDMSRQKYPSTYLTLHYMITIYAEGDYHYRIQDEQKILGKIVQVLKEYTVFHRETYEVAKRIDDKSIVIQPDPLNFDEKVRIWTSFSQPYRLSLFYKVTPVEIEAENMKKVTRVTSIDFTVGEDKK